MQLPRVYYKCKHLNEFFGQFVDVSLTLLVQLIEEAFNIETLQNSVLYRLIHELG